MLMRKKTLVGWVVALAAAAAVAYATPSLARQWKETDFANRPLFAYPLPRGREDIVGSLMTYTIDKGDLRIDMLRSLAKTHGRPVIYVNQVGGNDSLVFDGGSMVIMPDGPAQLLTQNFAVSLEKPMG